MDREDNCIGSWIESTAQLFVVEELRWAATPTAVAIVEIMMAAFMIRE